MPTSKYSVWWTGRVDKRMEKLPAPQKVKLNLLIKDLREKGPIRKEWPNFSDLGKNKYHCHLSYHWAACWYWEKKTIKIEVTYAGSREGAPY